MLQRLLLMTASIVLWAQPTESFLQFDGLKDYVEIPDSEAFSVSTTGSLTVSAWIRPAALAFPSTEGTGYVHWMGKGDKGEQEWVLRMYGQPNRESRANRISFYVFNPDGGAGVGSYFQEEVTPGEWLHVVGTANNNRTAIYRNGVFMRCDQYRGIPDKTCISHPLDIDPHHGTAPVRIGTRDRLSFFQGDMRDVRIWNRTLSSDEVEQLFSAGAVPKRGLVAEYLFRDGKANDTAGSHNGTIHH